MRPLPIQTFSLQAAARSCRGATSERYPRSIGALKLFLPLLYLIALTQHSNGQTRVWVGASNSWNQASNWASNVVPVSNGSLQFGAAGAGGSTLNNDLTTPSFNVAGIEFTAGAGSYTFNGGAFTLSGNLTNNSGIPQVINTDFAVSNSTVRNVILKNVGGDILLGGSISGNGGLKISSGSGALTLSGTNSYSGETSVSAGTLILRGSNTSSGSTSVLNGSTLWLAGASNGGLAAGSLSVISGTLGVLGQSAVVSSDVGITLAKLTGSGSLSVAGTLRGLPGAGSTSYLDNYLVPGTVMTVSRLIISDQTVKNGTFMIRGGGQTMVTGPILDGGSLGNWFWVRSSYVTLQGENTYSGDTQVDSASGPTATLVLAGSNSSNGKTVISSSVLRLEGSNNGGLAAGSLDLYKSTVEVFKTAATLSSDLTLKNENSFTGSKNITFAGTTALVTGNGTLNNFMDSSASMTLSKTTLAGTLTISGTGETNITGPIVNSGTIRPGSVVVKNTNRTTISGENAYSGLTRLDAGTVVLLGNNSSSGSTDLRGADLWLGGSINGGLASGSLSLFGGSLRAVNEAAGSATDLTLSNLVYLAGNITVGDAQSTTGLNLSGSMTLVGTNTLTVNGSATISGTIGDSNGFYGLNKNGVGTLVLAGTNTYSGETGVSAGTLILRGANTSSGPTTVSRSSTLLLAGESNGGLAAGSLSVTSGTLGVLGQSAVVSSDVAITLAKLTGSGSLSVTGTLRGLPGAGSTSYLDNYLDPGTVMTVSRLIISDQTVKNGTFMIRGGGQTMVTGPILDGGSLGNWFWVRSSYVTLQGENTYSGDTQVDSASGTTATLVLAGSNNSNGKTVISSSVLRLEGSSNGGLAAGSLDLYKSTVEVFKTAATLSSDLTLKNENSFKGSKNITFTGTTALVTGDGALNNLMGAGAAMTLSRTVLAGSLTISGSGETIITGPIVDSELPGAKAGTLVADSTNRTTISGQNTYSGLTRLEAGTVVLLGNNSSSGSTHLNGGDLWLGGSINGGLASGSLSLFGGSLRAVNGATGSATERTLSNMVYLAGNITMGDVQSTTGLNLSGSMTLVGTNTLTVNGATTISGGIGDGDGFYGLTKNGTGTLVLAGTNTFKGGMNIDQGVVQLGASERLLDAGSLKMNGGTFDLNGNTESVGTVHLAAGSVRGGTLYFAGFRASSGVVSSILAGSGSFEKVDSGQVVLNSASTSTGEVSVYGGTLTLGVPNAISSRSSVSVRGGTLDLGGFSTYAGTVTLVDGTLRGGSMQSAFVDLRKGTVSANLVGVSSLVKTTSDTALIDGMIQATGNLSILGGTLRIAHDLELAGEVDISNSRVVLDSAVKLGQTACIRVQSGGTFDVTASPGGYQIDAAQILCGNRGYVRGTILLAGMLAPGNSPGMTTLGGLKVLVGSTLQVEVQQTEGMPDQWDKVVIDPTLAGTGKAELSGNGTVVVKPIGRLLRGATYRIIDASAGGSVDGKFSDVMTGSALYKPTLLYGPDFVDLQLQLGAVGNYGRNPSERSLGHYIDGLWGKGTPAMQNFQNALLALPNEKDISTALGQISATAYADLLPLSRDRLLSIFSGIAGRLDSPPPGAADTLPGGTSSQNADKKWTAWTTASTSSLSREAKSKEGFGGYHFSSQASSVGLEKSAGGLVAGFFGSVGSSNAGFASPSVDVKTDTVHIGAYGSVGVSQFTFDGILSYGKLSHEARRSIEFPSFEARTNADFQGDEFAARLGGACHLLPKSGVWLVSLNDHVSVIGTRQDGFEEKNGGALAMKAEQARRVFVTHHLGLTMGRRFTVARTPCGLKLRCNWLHDFQNSASFRGGLVGAPSDAGYFDVSASPGGSDSVNFSGALEMQLTDSMQMTFGGEFAARNGANKGSASVSLMVTF